MLLRRACVAVALLVATGGIAGAPDVPRGPARKDRAPTASDARSLTSRIDSVLAAHWAEAGIKPAAVADDGEFLRRASLDLIGKIPTAAEARDFLDDPGKDK